MARTEAVRAYLNYAARVVAVCCDRPCGRVTGAIGLHIEPLCPGEVGVGELGRREWPGKARMRIMARVMADIAYNILPCQRCLRSRYGIRLLLAGDMRGLLIYPLGPGHMGLGELRCRKRPDELEICRRVERCARCRVHE